MKNKLIDQNEVCFLSALALMIGAVCLGAHPTNASDDTSIRHQVNVNYQGAVVNLLQLVAEDERVAALGELTSQSCYLGNESEVISRLNGVFRMFVRSDRLREADLSVRYIGASSRRLDEKPGTIGIQYEDLNDDFRQKRLSIRPCEGPGLLPNSEPAPLSGGVFVQLSTGGTPREFNLFQLISEDERLSWALGALSSASCYRGDLIQAVTRLNGIFNMAEGSKRLREVSIGKKFVQATTPKLNEPRNALGVEFETAPGQARKRFLISVCR
jgi:hypothetical protein